MASPKIQIKRGITTPLVSDFSQGELALNHNNNTLYAQSGALTGGTGLAAGGTFSISNVTAAASVSYLGVMGYTATMTSTESNSGVVVGDILRGTNVSGGGQFPTTAQCIVIAISTSPFLTLTFWSSGAPTAGAVTAVTKTSPLKWVGAEIENTLTSTNFNKLTTQAGIATYIGNNSLALGGGTLMGTLNLSNSTNTTPGELRLLEASGNTGSHYAYIKAPADLSGNFGITLPNSAPTANQVLTSSNTAGVLTWTTPAAVPTITPVSDTSTGTALQMVFVDAAGTGLSKNSSLNFIPTTGVLTSTALSATDGAANSTSSLNGTSLTTGAGTFNLINATATTVNFAGVATTLSIGAGTGTTTINNNTVITGNLTTTGTTVHNGNFTVQGTQTFLNTTVMTVTDKNIELGFATATSGLAVSTSFTFGLITFSNQGTVARIGSTGSFGKITFSASQIPTGVRPGTELNSGISTAGTAGYLGGGTITVTSITPTQIFYTAGSGVPIAGTTTSLGVTNDYISSIITLSGSGSTTNMAVGSSVIATLVGGSGSLNVATVALIDSSTTFKIVNRGAITGTVSSASGIATGASSDTTADGGGFTLKGTTDKTFTWVSAANSTWPSGRFSMNQPLEVVQTATGTLAANNSCLRLKSDATLDADGLVGGGAFVDTMIEFTNITTSAGTTATAWFGVDKNNRLKFQTSRNNDVFSVDSTGKVEDCTIDCGTF